MDDIKSRAQKIKAIVTDVDGVLNNGKVYINHEGEESFGEFSIYDGIGIELAFKYGLIIAVISGRSFSCSAARCKKLGVTEVYTGIKDKRAKFLEITDKFNLKLEEVAYIGDDIVDIEPMKLCGLRVSPVNGVQAIKNIANYVTHTRGGEGVLREVIDLILTTQGYY